MKAVRPFVIALSLLTAGFACDRSPTGVPERPAPTGLLSCSALHSEPVTQVIGPEGGSSTIGPSCFGPEFRAQAPERDRNSNYAVAW